MKNPMATYKRTFAQKCIESLIVAGFGILFLTVLVAAHMMVNL